MTRRRLPSVPPQKLPLGQPANTALSVTFSLRRVIDALVSRWSDWADRVANYWDGARDEEVSSLSEPESLNIWGQGSNTPLQPGSLKLTGINISPESLSYYGPVQPAKLKLSCPVCTGSHRAVDHDFLTSLRNLDSLNSTHLNRHLLVSEVLAHLDRDQTHINCLYQNELKSMLENYRTIINRMNEAGMCPDCFGAMPCLECGHGL